MKEGAARIRQRVSTALHPALVWAKRVGDRVGFWEYEKPDEDTSRFGEKEWQCPECGKVMHEGVKEPHQESHEPEIDERVEDANSKTHFESDSRGDLVDDYDPDWLEDEEKESGIEIQEATGKSNVKKKQLREKWSPFIEELQESGKVVVTRHQHHGGLRGAHIVQRMKRDFKRLDLEMEVEFDIGESKSVVRVDSL